MRKSYDGLLDESNFFSEATEKFVRLVGKLQSSEMLNREHGDVERMLHTEGLEVMRLMYQAHLDNRTEVEVLRDSVKGSDGVSRTHRRKNVVKKVSTLFGAVEVRRVSYSSTIGGALYPMDKSLNLGPTKYSHGLCHRVVVEASKSSFDECVHSLKSTTGGHVPKRQCEQIVSRAARDFEDYYQNTAEVADQKKSNLLVLTMDSKGIVMRTEDLRPATKKAAQCQPKTKARLSPGEKKNRKRMATTAAVYSVNPMIRKPEEIMDSDAEKPKRPKIENKRVWASVERNQKAVISEAIDEALSRDPKHKRKALRKSWPLS